jgi:histidyl-tRNA synthetase
VPHGAGGQHEVADACRHKAGAAWAVIRGDDELAQDVVALKDMVSGVQETFPRERLAGELAARAAAAR